MTEEGGKSKLDLQLGFDRSCPDCGAKRQRPNFKCCEDAERNAGKIVDKAFRTGWSVVKSHDMPEHLEGTDVHHAAMEWEEHGLIVDWLDGNVNNPKMTLALFNMWDHYDEETGDEL